MILNCHKEKRIKVADLRWFGNRYFRLQEIKLLGYHNGVYEDDVICIVMSCTLIAVSNVSVKPAPFVRLDCSRSSGNVRVTKELSHFHNKWDVDCTVTELKHKPNNPTRKNWCEMSRAYRTDAPPLLPDIQALTWEHPFLWCCVSTLICPAILSNSPPPHPQSPGCCVQI